MGARGPGGYLADKEFCNALAALLIEGQTHKEIAATLDVNEISITKWRKDPRVKAPMLRMAQERALRVTRLTDAIIEGRLSQAQDMTIKELLSIRSAFAGTDLFKKANEAADETDAALDILEAVEKDPDKARQLAALLEL